MESWHIINSLFYLICALYLFKDISCVNCLHILTVSAAVAAVSQYGMVAANLRIFAGVNGPIYFQRGQLFWKEQLFLFVSLFWIVFIVFYHQY